ncbi:helicase-related protein [Cellulomonas triticagri]|uniref:DEAD/DEAH box helicase n=1 Tax=Cellulomonas triticagri TaxID=2483352 RepID=A0A3M2JKE6_9CELL|nr:helicase-related protein [Cellulomonas triticagri]RMI14302.1 DEAD/DEAH box helicase [Cellulomonas triticagri]
MTTATYAPGSLVRARGREWVVLPDSRPEFLLLRPLGGGNDDVAGLHTALEPVEDATYPLPSPDDLGDATSAGLLRTALQLGFRSSAGPFRSLAGIAVEPRAYQLVPLLMALRQDTVRMLVADDVGIGKTVEAGLIAAELLAQGDAKRLAVLCSPALAEQWQAELASKFHIQAELVLTSTVRRLERDLMMNESLFDRYPHVVVSTDFIKSDRHRAEFLNHCPDLVIVDEAHTAVSDTVGGGRQRHRRHELLEDLARDPKRHLILVTATPHSGKDEGFRSLVGLLDPELATIDLDRPHGRERLARHFVQRRRGDIRRYLDEDTQFPSDRELREVAYALKPEYRALFTKVLDYAREQVRDAGDGTVRQRVRWWSVLALLRTLASSPAAAAATLRMRAAAAEAADLAEADALGRASVLDTADDEAVEAADVTPGALTEDAETTTPSERSRLRALAQTAESLLGPAADAKLSTLVKEVKGLLADGFDPIVFCRFIDTAEYVGKHLADELKKTAEVAVVTGTLPPAERQERIRALTATDARHVLVATDCLSEGVNLQDAFQAVVHYDLAWNPTRHEQREGRVDRFGQTAPTVRAVTIYGKDNSIDGLVLDVLIRRHQAISKATGVSVPVPSESDSLLEALLEGLLLRGVDHEQLELDLGLKEADRRLEVEWRSVAETERASRTKYAQGAIHPDDVALEVAEVRSALGAHGQIEPFVEESLRALGASVTSTGDGFEAITDTLTPGLRDALPLGFVNPLPFHRQMPVPRRHALLVRTDPSVEAVARYVLDTALDSATTLHRAPARRAGVVRTRHVAARTTALLLRYRFHLDLPAADGPRTLIAEDCEVVAFRGQPDAPDLLPTDEVTSLLAAQADANVPADQARDHIAAALERVSALGPLLDSRAGERADRLLESHRRVRAGAGATRQGLRVRAQTPVDVLGVYLYLPVVGSR